MFQPFVKMNFKFVDGFIKLNKFYLVSQTYTKGNVEWEEGIKQGILFTEYDDKGLALNHKDAIRKDKYAAVLDLSKPEHKEKLLSMMKADSQYAVYWAAVMNKDRLKYMLDNEYRDNLKRYIDNCTGWRPGRNDTVYPVFQVIFGEIHIVFKYGRQEQRARLDDVINS